MTISPPPPAATKPVPPSASAPARRRAATLRVVATMARKEARELAPWLMLVTLAYSAALVFVLFEIIHARQSASSILTSAFYAVSILMSPAAAMLLGFMQMEIRPDRYAFLVHRPASRSLIFWSKVLTGVPLYLVSTGVPMLLALAWASNPANMPLPFTWEMALAPAADILMGIPFFLAGMMVARRTGARWWGSRLLPLGAPGVIGVVALVMPQFHWAVLVLALAALLYLVPMRALFVSGGEERRLSRLACACLGLILIGGIMLAGGAALGITSAFSEPRSYTTNYTYYQFLKDGTPVRTIMLNGKSSVETLDGKPVADGADIYLPMSAVATSDHYLTPQSFDRTGFHDADNYFTVMTTLEDGITWFRHARGDYVVGFDLQARRLIGAIGVDGFTAGAAVPAVKFPSPVILARRPQTMQSLAVVAYGSSAFEMSPSHALVPLFKTPDGSPIRGIAQVFSIASLQGGQQSIWYVTCFTTQKDLYVLNQQNALQFQVPLEYSDTEYVTIGRVAATGEFIIRVNETPSVTGEVKDDRVLVVSQRGETVRRFTLPMTHYDVQRASMFFEDTLVPAVVPPAALLMMGTVRHVMEPASLAKDMSEFVRFLGLSFGVSVPLAVVMFIMGRRWRMKMSSTLLWTVLTLLLGPTGVFLFFSLRGVPTRTRCHACGKLRPVDQHSCPSCGAEFAAPARNGTEIFA